MMNAATRANPKSESPQTDEDRRADAKSANRKRKPLHGFARQLN
jgi:hypothetical protein